MASALPPPGCSGAISRCASRERNIRTAPTYADIVSARSTAPGFFFCLEPARRINSANSTSVSRL
eukprot:2011668-Pleurochrysis_carterae.AAC.1